MIEASYLSVVKGRTSLPGQLVQFDRSDGWHLRFASPSGDDGDEPLQWLLEFGGEYPLTCYELNGVINDPMLALSDFRLQVDPSSQKAIRSLHGMEGWAILTENGPGVVAVGPSRVPPRNLIVGLDGQLQATSTDRWAFAFSRWQIVAGRGEEERVILAHSAGGGES